LVGVAIIIGVKSMGLLARWLRPAGCVASASCLKRAARHVTLIPMVVERLSAASPSLRKYGRRLDRCGDD